MKFPKITIADMVETQHRVLSEELKLKHVHAVIGGSMGGMQAFQWAVQFPTFMDAVIAISGSTQLTSRDLMLWRAEKNAIFEHKDWNGGNYKAPLHIPALEDIHKLALETPERFNDEIPPKGYDAAVKEIETADNFDPSDRVRQLDAMMTLDISKRFGGKMYAASKAVKARMLIVVCNQDQMVNPRPALIFAEHLLTNPLQFDSLCGHLGAGCRSDLVVPAVQQVLAKK